MPSFNMVVYTTLAVPIKVTYDKNAEEHDFEVRGFPFMKSIMATILDDSDAMTDIDEAVAEKMSAEVEE